MLRKKTKTFIVRGVSSAFVLSSFLSGCADSPHKIENRLGNASSPYLLEHADNPVDWYEWGDEALARAKKENKPLLVSIGYASCHWCHVMEEESFMDTAVARIMNDNFICIKVDREERPDIDNVYMNACQLLSGNSGWPLNAFALPDGKPFFAGTYYSKKSWLNLLNQVALAYKEKKDLAVKQADELTKGIAEEGLAFLKNEKPLSVFSKDAYRNLFDSIYSETDIRNGGIKGYPKFPMPALTDFMLQYYYYSGNRQALDAATTTLTHMALGGIYDQVGGGFARYSTDSSWHIPHFEKMLYDNGQLISVYAHAYQLTKNDFFKTILTETISFVDAELSSPEGGFYSSLNADTEDGEGAYYSWSFDEFKKIAAGETAELAAEYYAVSPGGNWEKNRNILFAAETPGEYAAMRKIKAADFAVALNAIRTRLLTERNKRKKPAVDTKILTAWNAIMLKGYADAYTATGEKKYLDRALTAGGFIEKNMIAKDGHLWRNYKDKKTTIDAFLDDYAWTASAYIRLYQVTFDKHWLNLAVQLSGYAVSNFFDTRSGMFYYSSSASSNLAVRKIETADNAIPSSNAVMAGVLYDLGVYFDNSEYAKKSANMFSVVSATMSAMPVYYTQWCHMAGAIAHGTYEIAIMGKDAGVKNLELQRNYLPSCMYLGQTEEENLPLLANKLAANKTMIYVCTNKQCKIPVEEVSRALAQIN